MKKPKIAILMLCYNDLKSLEYAISSVLDQQYENFELIFIDNNSTDDSVNFVRSRFPDVEIVENRENIGYARAYKKELGKIFFGTDYDAAILLNSDIVVGKGWLSELVTSAFSDERIAFAQPKIFLHRKGLKTKIANSFGNKIHFLGFGFCDNYEKEDSRHFSADRNISSGSGCCLLVKKRHYFEIGDIDETYEYYLEDQDLSWRALQKGYKIVLSAKSKMWHKYNFENEKNPKKFMLYERNRIYFVFKNYSTKTILLLLPAMFVMEGGVLIDALQRRCLGGKLNSYFEFIENIPRLLAKRRVSQEKREIKDRDLLKHLESELTFPEIDNRLLRFANKAFTLYFKVVSNFI